MHLWLAVLMLLSWPLKAEDQAETLFERALVLIKDGEESAAENSLNDFLRQYPKHENAARAIFELGRLKFVQREYSEAELILRRLYLETKEDKNYWPKAALYLGRSLEKQGHKEEALIEWHAVERRYPKSSYSKEARNLILGMEK